MRPSSPAFRKRLKYFIGRSGSLRHLLKLLGRKCDGGSTIRHIRKVIALHGLTEPKAPHCHGYAFDVKRARAACKTLSGRQKAIAHFIRRGFCRKEIAEILGISINTVEDSCGRIHAKLGVADDTQVAITMLPAPRLRRRVESVVESG